MVVVSKRGSQGMSIAPTIEVEIDASAQPLLTDSMPLVLEGALGVLRDVAQRFNIPDSTVTVYRDRSYEDSIDQLVLTHDVVVSTDAAFAYWEALADAVEVWTKALPAPLRKLAESRIAVAVDWPLSGR
jgi:hypothetical protein